MTNDQIPSIADVSVRLEEVARLADILGRAAISGVIEDVNELGAVLGVLARDVRATLEVLDGIEKAAMPAQAVQP